MEVLVFSQPQLPCFQIWKFIQLKHPLKMGCFEDSFPPPCEHEMCYSKARGCWDVFDLKKTGFLSSFSRRVEVGEVGAIFPSHKKMMGKYDANMSPTRCFFFWRTCQAVFVGKIWFLHINLRELEFCRFRKNKEK